MPNDEFLKSLNGGLELTATIHLDSIHKGHLQKKCIQQDCRHGSRTIPQ